MPRTPERLNNSVAAEALERVAKRLSDGRISPGERIVEDKLALDLGMSRTPVREALIMLHGQGLVRRTRSGWVAETYSLEEIRDAFTLRATLESLAARLAAERATQADMRAIRAVLDRSRRFLSRDPIIETGARDVESGASDDGSQELLTIGSLHSEFHRSIVAASHHGRLERAVIELLTAPLIFHAVPFDTREEILLAERFHSWLADAISARDGARAERLMMEHIARSEAIVVGPLASRRASAQDDEGV